MAKVKYKPGTTSQYGYDFADGKAVEVTDAKHLAKFRGNPFFEVIEAKEPAKSEDNELKAVHRGRGSFSIMQGDKELKEGLSKEDADAFNAMSDGEKAEYVK
ncbi:hypothetical protein QTA58_00235 [Neorhizobium sp. CSC1952]|uniref:hypothetical protein n=1 Tax=Neorhizobium sp. CSC1952 TaxID=2978974 RepID=UPI0025A5E3E9|nr:hypothetical protein [Rhizobium sp. CSC1952]WJR67237.1 hypothetical protein QTA58_00235 [Rhizobium sp. CSC1952]